ncbi:MAG TPA: hypothetical protein VGG72_06640 [Bryobacteraceae bacterium]|jgi:hypothetical protein
MLWYKAWLETRLRVLIGLGWFGVLVVTMHLIGNRAAPGGPPPAAGFALMAMSQMVVIASMLAGTGIATQAPFQEIKGLQGSTPFTLSLPVSRFQLLAVRAGLGWLEMAGLTGTFCFANWLGSPWLNVTAIRMLEYAGTLITCSSALYFTTVMLATFLNEWRLHGSFIAFAAIWWIPSHTPLPPDADIFRAMGEGSPLIAHAIPWGTMLVSLALSALLFFAALMIAQRREY